MSFPWFSPNDATQGLLSPDYFTHIDNIVDSLQSCITIDADGKTTLDVEAFMQMTSDAMLDISTSGGLAGFSFQFAFVSQSFRPIVERLADKLLETTGVAGTSGPPLDLQPYLDDCRLKSDAVTDYFDGLYAGIPDLLAESFASGSLTKNVPEADDTTKETRYLITTFVNDWENESQPSPVSDQIELGTKDTVTVNRPTVPGSRNLSYWRIYRSNSGNQGAAFQYVPNAADDLGIPVATASFLDDVPNSELQEVCPTLIWAEPDADMRGVVAMANGIHVGFMSRAICPSESYIPFAFPVEYRKTINEEIVALCAWEQTCFVATRGRPFYLMGVDSANLTVRPIDGEACVAPRSVALTRWGPVYASADGLCLAVPDTPTKVLTQEHFTKEEWSGLTALDKMVVAEHDGIIYMMRDNAGPPGPAYVWDVDAASSTVTFTGTDGITFQRNATVPDTAIVRILIPRTAGKWYAELQRNDALGGAASNFTWFGIGDENVPNSFASIATAGNYVAYRSNGQVFQNNALIANTGVTYDSTRRMAVDVNCDTGLVRLYRDNVLVASTTLTVPHNFYLLAAIEPETLPRWTLMRDLDDTMLYPAPTGYTYWG